MIGMRHSVLAAAQNTTCAVLMSLIALQWVQVGKGREHDIADDCHCAGCTLAVPHCVPQQIG